MSASEEPWYAVGLCFSCTRCGACCRGPDPGYVFVSEEEVERLAASQDLGLQEFSRRYLRRVQGGRLSLRERANCDCVFWQEEMGCQVYRDRPGQCRQFPFWPEGLVSAQSWKEENDFCPGVGKGCRYSLEEIQKISSGEQGTCSGKRPQSP